jgi:subtilisin family serine protease
MSEGADKESTTMSPWAGTFGARPSSARPDLPERACVSRAPLTSPIRAFDLVRLGPLMALSSGSMKIGVGLVDGPVAVDHPDLAEASIRPAGVDGTACSRSDTEACFHGTFVAGILVARRGSPAPAICPRCTLLVRPIFRETGADGALPTAAPDDVGNAVGACVDAGARVVNLSAATGAPSTRGEMSLRHALDYAARRGVLVVAAAGNQGMLGSSEITRHPGVVPVAAYDLSGRPMNRSNFGKSTGRWGLGAPGDGIVSLAADGTPATRAGTSFAAAFVTGAIALLWSLFPMADAASIRRALSQGPRRTTVIPPLMDAYAAYERLAARF